MTTEEIVEECNRRFPIGSIVKHMWEDGEISGESVIRRNARVISDIERGSVETSIDMGEGYVYTGGKFTEVLSYPKGYKKPEKIINDYLVF